MYERVPKYSTAQELLHELKVPCTVTTVLHCTAQWVRACPFTVIARQRLHYLRTGMGLQDGSRTGSHDPSMVCTAVLRTHPQTLFCLWAQALRSTLPQLLRVLPSVPSGASPTSWQSWRSQVLRRSAGRRTPPSGGVMTSGISNPCSWWPRSNGNKCWTTTQHTLTQSRISQLGRSFSPIGVIET